MQSKESALKPTNYPALYTLAGVFFFWGFIAASNGVFIPFCKSKFQLSQFQSQLIDSAFYFAYYIGAFLLFLFSVMRKHDLLNAWGFKNGIVYGLLISVSGAWLMFPALASNNFNWILAALFVVALGFSLQQTAAQPFAISLGDERTGAHRLNLAGGINSFGTTIGPIIFALALLGSTTLDESLIRSLSLDTVQWLYVGVGCAFLIAALLFKFSKKLPDLKQDASLKPERKATIVLSLITLLLLLVLSTLFYFSATGSGSDLTVVALLVLGIFGLVLGLLYANQKAKKKSEGWGALKYPQLVLGMLGIFAYVGVEVAIQSNLGEYLKYLDFEIFSENTQVGYAAFLQGLEDQSIEGYWTGLTPLLISLYWGSLMIGRWAGAVAVFDWSSKRKKWAMIWVPYLAFLVILLVNIIGAGESGNRFPVAIVSSILPYFFVVLIQILGFYFGQENPAKTLMIFSILGGLAMVIGMSTTGAIAVFSFVSGGLFCSVMWPCIFSLATQGLGNYTSQGSSFLVMMILGGAFIPPLQGVIADMTTIKMSYIISVLCFVYLAYFAISVSKILKNQGIDLKAIHSGGSH